MYEIKEELTGLCTTCASCKKGLCEYGVTSGPELPGNCPMRNEQYMATVFEPYTDPDIHAFYVGTKVCTGTEDEHRYTARLKGVLNLCRYMGYKRIGLAFCRDFIDEAQLYASVIRKFGFECVAVCCANGGFLIDENGNVKKAAAGERPSCNPIGQARLMNEQKTDFNLVFGLCAGEDALFVEHSDAMCTTVFVKDPMMGHTPLAALRLARYHADIFTGEPREGK